MVEDLVFQDSDQPALFRTSSSESFTTFERGQKGFLNHVLGFRRVAQTDESKLEEGVAMLLHPTFGVRQARRRCSPFRRGRNWSCLSR